jgi:large subunit ribosomal protein L3
MANQSLGLLGTKLGMTQLFDAEGNVTPVTVIQVGPNRVLQVKTSDTKDGYNAIQLGFGTQKAHRLGKAILGHFAKSGEVISRHVAEFRLPAAEAATYTAGQEIGAADVFTEGGWVDATGTSKGRGFTGVMKRWNFAGFERSHGVHEYFRHGGSIGTRLTPGMTLKGKRMGGHYGSERVTIQNIRVVKIDAERNLVFIHGAVPGPKGGLVRLRKAVKGGK